MAVTRRLRAAGVADPHLSDDELRSLLWHELDEVFQPAMDPDGGGMQWPVLSEVYSQAGYCIARLSVNGVYGMYRLDFVVSDDETDVEFTGDPVAVDLRYVQKGTLTVVASKVVDGADADADKLLAELKKENPLIAEIDKGPNGHAIVLDLVPVGSVSAHQGDIQYRLAVEGLDKAVSSIVGKPLHVTDAFDGHFMASKDPKAVGVFLGGVKVPNPDSTVTFRTVASLWDADFPTVAADLKANRKHLGGSYEITYLTASARRDGNVVTIADYAFSGGAILYKTAAAHKDTQLLIAGSGETAPDTYDIFDEVHTSKLFAFFRGHRAYSQADVMTTKTRNDLSDSDFALIQTVNGKKVRRFPINDESHRKNAWARLSQGKDMTDAERSSTADKIMNKAKSAGDDWAKDYTKSGGKWEKKSTSSAQGGSAMSKFRGIPDEHEVIVENLIASARREVEGQLATAETTIKELRLKAQQTDDEAEDMGKKAKKSAESLDLAEKAKIAAENQVVVLTTKVEAMEKELGGLKATLAEKTDALDAIEVEKAMAGEWAKLKAEWGIEDPEGKLFEARKPLLTKLLSSKEGTKITADDFKQLVARADGKVVTAAGQPATSKLIAGLAVTTPSVDAATAVDLSDPATREQIARIWPHATRRQYI